MPLSKICIASFLLTFFFSHEVFTQPSVSFHPSRMKVCSGSVVSLINTSSGANSFSWFIDGTFISSARDTSVTLFESCYDMKEIGLTGCDSISGLCDSSMTFVEVFDTCFFHWTADIIQCPGDTVSLNANPEAIATQWNIQPAHPYLAGCPTCSSITIVLQHNQVLIEKNSVYDGNCSDITSYHYFCSLGVSESEKDAIKIFPNPFTDFIVVEAQVHSLQLYNTTGRCVSVFDEGFATGLQFLPSGLYFLKVNYQSGNEMRSSVHKLIKESE